MALKDKLMTLEDFKAVRDVDVASNSAQFTEIKADLGALSNLDTSTKTDLVSAINEAAKSGFSDDAKEALLDCFESIALWSDGQGREHIEALREALYPDEEYLKIYKGVGLNTDFTEYAVNTARCISDLINFDNSEPFELDIDVPIGLMYAIKPMDENGNIWTFNASTDAYNVGYADENNTPLASTGWITSNGRVKLHAYRGSSGDMQTKVTLPNTNGTFRLLFKKSDNSDFTEIPACTLYLEDGAITTVEGDPNEIL